MTILKQPPAFLRLKSYAGDVRLGEPVQSTIIGIDKAAAFILQELSK